MATVVVCDDDEVVRSTVSALCEEAGLEVVAETDSGSDATELIRRFGVNVLVLDLSLSDGSGERTLATLGEAGSEVAVIVFSAYATDPARLGRMGAREVIDKPDFGLLADVLARLATTADRTLDHSDDRRSASRSVDVALKIWRSPSGVSSHHDLSHSLQTIEVGDAILAISVVGLSALETAVGPLLVADCRLAVAGILRHKLRVQDLLHEAPEVDGFVALLRGGDARAAGAVWARVTSAMGDSALPGEVKGSTGLVGAIGPKEAVARAIGALRDATTGGPALLEV